MSYEAVDDGINAWDISDDAELHRAWQVPVAELSTTLDEAMEQIAQWSRRRLRS